MMQQIRVSPDELVHTAQIINNQKEEYQSLYLKLFQLVDQLSTHWEGKDNLAFVNRIRYFEGDLRKIALIMGQYSEFLQSSANAYSATQNELFDEINRLRS